MAGAGVVPGQPVVAQRIVVEGDEASGGQLVEQGVGGVDRVAGDSASATEAARVLRPEGRLQIGDILVDRTVPEGAKRNIDLWKG